MRFYTRFSDELFDHPAQKTEDLVSYGSEEATVVLEFEVAGRRLQVTRRLHKTKPTRANLEELTSHNPTTIATGHEKVNEQIVNLLGGITYHEIVSSTVVAQKELSKLIELNKDDRKRIINAFLNLESFNEVLSELTDERRELEGRGSFAGRIETETEKLHLLQQDLSKFRQVENERLQIIQQNRELEETIEGVNKWKIEKDDLYSILTKFDTVARQRQQLTSQLDARKQVLLERRNRFVQIRNETNAIREQLSKYDYYDSVKSTLLVIENQLNGLNQKQVELLSAEQSLGKVQQEVSVLQSKISSEPVPARNQLPKPVLPYLLACTTLFLSALASFAFSGINAITLILFLCGVGPALVAARRLNTATTIARQNVSLGELRYLDEKRCDLVTAERIMRKLKQEIEIVEHQLAETCQTLPRYGEVFRVNSNQGCIKAVRLVLEASKNDKDAIRMLSLKLETMRTELSKEESLEESEKEIRKFESQLSELTLPQLPAGIIFSASLLADTVNIRNELTKQITEARTKLEQNMRRLTEDEKYLQEHNDILSKVRSQEATVKWLERRIQIVKCALEGIQSTAEALRNRIRPGVQAYMSVILPSLTSSLYKTAILDENYNLQVWDNEAGEYKPREVYSGGAEDQFLLAMRISFALALLPEAKGQKPEFVFLDEPLGSSDEIRRSGIVDYLSTDLTKKFKQIFIISHVGGLEEKVDNVISLTDGRVERTL